MTMPKDINELDAVDSGLQMIFGENFTDETKEQPEANQMPVFQKSTKAEESDRPVANPNVNPAKKVKAPAIEPKIEPKDAQWMPVKERNYLDRLKDCTKWVGVCGGLSMLFFYWEQTGQMLHSAAFPSYIVCAILAGFSVGKNFGKRTIMQKGW